MKKTYYWLVPYCMTQSAKIKSVSTQLINGVKRIRDIIDDWYINNLAKISVRAVFHSSVIWKSVSLKFIGICMLVPFRGARIWRPKSNRNICHWVLPLKKKIIILGFRYIENNSSYIARTIQLAKTWAITPRLTWKPYQAAVLMSHNTKTQTSSITKWGTLSMWS